MTDTNLPHTIPVFSSFRHRENQVSHGLAVALEQSSSFRLRLLTYIQSILPTRHRLQRYPPPILAKHAKFSVQSYFGASGIGIDEGTSKALPDILIQWDQNVGGDRYRPCLIIEAKIEAPWSKVQALNHQRLSSSAGYEPVGLAVTTSEIPSHDLPSQWISCAWGRIYQLARSVEEDFWADQLAKLLEITEAKLEMTSSLAGTLTRFSGIPFAKEEVEYNPLNARRIMRLLIGELKQTPSELKKHGIKISMPQTISSQADGSVWYKADPLTFFRRRLPNIDNIPHLNFTIGREQFSCGLTFPNASFNRTFRKGIEVMHEKDTLSTETEKLLKRFAFADGLRIQYTPYAYLQQLHFLSQKSPPKQDALIRFDLRTLSGEKNLKQKINIKQNDQWIDMITHLVLERPGHCHFQAGFGITVPYTPANLAFFMDPSMLQDFIIRTWSSLIPFAKNFANGT